ncbi:MAG: YihY/virulence factor BrkB family protein [Saprospiraceae bacterium]|nr:YihY/virulence factor BrkB family protein [Saprospiraceae bacterium]
MSDFFTRLYHYFLYHPLWLRLVGWSKTHSLPGLQRIPLYSLIVFIVKETRDDAITTRANSVAFSLFLALFPSIIVLFTLLPYTPLYEMKVSVDGVPEKFQDVLRNSISEVMPGEAGQMLFNTIEDIASKPRSGLLSFGFFLAIWFASNGMLSMMRGLEKNYKSTFKRRTDFQKRLIAIQLTFLVGLVLIASVVFVILGNVILNLVFTYVQVDVLSQAAFFGLRWVVVLLLFYSLFSTIYRYGSSTRRKIPFFNSGAMLATVLSILTSWGFSFYVNNFGNYNALYGSIGTLIVLMLWIQLNCMILLLGFELNAGIAVLRDQRREKREAEVAAKQ